MGLLAYVTDGGLVPVKNESAFATQRQIENTQKPSFVEYVASSGTANWNGGTGIEIYPVPAGRRFYLQSVFFYSGSGRFLCDLHDCYNNFSAADNIKTYGFLYDYYLLDLSPWLWIQSFSSPIVFDKAVLIDSPPGAKTAVYTLIGYLL